MTEEEAKTKVCPMSFNAPAENCAMPCCGSNCACWVWTAVLQNPKSQENALIRPHYETSKTQGHCGLIR